MGGYLYQRGFFRITPTKMISVFLPLLARGLLGGRALTPGTTEKTSFRVSTSAAGMRTGSSFKTVFPLYRICRQPIMRLGTVVGTGRLEGVCGLISGDTRCELI